MINYQKHFDKLQGALGKPNASGKNCVDRTNKQLWHDDTCLRRDLHWCRRRVTERDGDNHELEDRKVLKCYRPKIREVYFHSRTIFDEERLRLQKCYGLTYRLSGYLNKILLSAYIGGKGVKGMMEALDSFSLKKEIEDWAYWQGFTIHFIFSASRSKKSLRNPFQTNATMPSCCMPEAHSQCNGKDCGCKCHYYCHY